jgi:hypothetical protein
MRIPELLFANQELALLGQEKLKLIERLTALETSNSRDNGLLLELIPLVKEQTLQSKEQTLQTEKVLPFLQDLMLNLFDLVATSGNREQRHQATKRQLLRGSQKKLGRVIGKGGKDAH